MLDCDCGTMRVKRARQAYKTYLVIMTENKKEYNLYILKAIFAFPWLLNSASLCILIMRMVE